MRYKPFGEVRYTWKSSDPEIIPSAYALTRQTFTGQYSYMDDPSTAGVEGFGVMFYNARWYDPYTGRMAQADTIVPGGVQGLDRYAYVSNNPVNHTDPTGHCDDLTDYACRINPYLTVMVTAGIHQQSWGFAPLFNAGVPTRAGWIYPDEIFRDSYDSKGSAKISDEQMNAAYGTEVCDPGSDCETKGYGDWDGDRGLAVGLFGLDQHYDSVAKAGMARKISFGLQNVCAAGRCTATDMMMVAVLAANGEITAHNYKDLKNAIGTKKYTSSDGTFNWKAYLGDFYEGDQLDQILNGSDGTLSAFLSGVDSDFRDAHPEFDWNYLERLIVK
ncbi:MAG: RHS repeat-associated core domain-containing protein [Anaerolineales bacterium]|nr:RHS repeat-associated core domain-containing protein [Anaerolineales bacterium]